MSQCDPSDVTELEYPIIYFVRYIPVSMSETIVDKTNIYSHQKGESRLLPTDLN